MAMTKGQRRRNARIYSGDPTTARFIVERSYIDRSGQAHGPGADVTEDARVNANLRALLRRGVLRGLPAVDHRSVPGGGLSKGVVPQRTGSSFPADPGPRNAEKHPEGEHDTEPAGPPDPKAGLAALNGRHGEKTIRDALEEAGVEIPEGTEGKDALLELARAAAE